ncbi:MAG: hypothetical protein ACTHJ8_12455 [Mucilaginibacter sp.]
MSLFDFPRIHFSGNINVNVPTQNNCYFFPLAFYDTKKSKAFLPPRLYLPLQVYNDLFDPTKNPNPPPIKPPTYTDNENNYGDGTFIYIEITPINTIEILRQWCMTPVCQTPEAPDYEYIQFYQAANNLQAYSRQGMGLLPIIGNCPGYWNMFGDMGVSILNTTVTSVQTFSNGAVNTYTKASPNIPPEIIPLLNASFDLDTEPGNGRTSATMVETISNQSIYANVFCSQVNLYDSNDPSTVYLSGTPFRFSALIYSAWRVVNWFPPMAGSGRFCSSVPLSEIPDAERSYLVKFFNANKIDPRPLQGVFVTFTILEVFENRYNPLFYQQNGMAQNPALSTTVGSITPWYAGDMRTGIMGRNLISAGNSNNVFTNRYMKPPNQNGPEIPVGLTPAISYLNDLGNGQAIFSVDMGNTWPEEITQPPNVHVGVPLQQGPGTVFETPTIGNLLFRYQNQVGQFAKIIVDPAVNSRAQVFTTGCIFDFVLNDPTLISNIENNLIQVYLEGRVDRLLLQESEYMMSSDQKGLYGEQGDIAGNGYQSYSEKREPCRLRIWQKGKPVTTPIQVGIAEYIVPASGNDPIGLPDNVTWVSMADNSIAVLCDDKMELNNNAVYYFVYWNQYPNNQIPIFAPANYTVMDTGAFVCLRVHPRKDYSIYIDKSNPQYTPPTYDVVYEEVFKLYDIVYPAMALVHPFNKATWDNPYIAGLVMQRTDPKLWNNILYMPRSRELSNSQYQLLKAWYETFQNP